MLNSRSHSGLGCVLERCDFSGMHLQNFNFAEGLEQTRYVECKFDGTRFGHVSSGQSRLERCSFRGVRMGTVCSCSGTYISVTEQTGGG